MPRLKLLTIGLAILLVIGVVYFATGYFQARSAITTLREKMTTTNQLLALIPAPPADLNTRLAAAQQENREARLNVLPDYADVTGIIAAIFTEADSFHVNASPLLTNEWRIKTVGGINYRVLDIDIAIEGSLTDFIAFINSLYGDTFNVAAVNSFSLTRTVTTGNIITGSVQLEVYTQPDAGAHD